MEIQKFAPLYFSSLLSSIPESYECKLLLALPLCFKFNSEMYTSGDIFNALSFLISNNVSFTIILLLKNPGYYRWRVEMWLV